MRECWARGVWRAKSLIFSRTMAIPRSSEAFSSRTLLRKLSGLRGRGDRGGLDFKKSGTGD